jgi:hypothetical protein
MLALVGPEQGDRRLLTDPLGVPPNVAVEDQVADHEDAGLAQGRDASDQVVSHAGSSLTAEKRMTAKRKDIPGTVKRGFALSRKP